jgi:hypothetical protein
MHYLRILIGEGKNNFIIEYDEEGAVEAEANALNQVDPTLN